MHSIPILAVCGHSGSGKTTLIEALLPLLETRGVRTAVLKHDAHRLTVDKPGKDSARFFDAGARVVLAHDATQGFLRWRKERSEDVTEWLQDALSGLPVSVDLILVEGHKDSPWPKFWLRKADETEIPESVKSVLAVFGFGKARPEAVRDLILEWMKNSEE